MLHFGFGDYGEPLALYTNTGNGTVTEPLDSISLDWISGRVTVVPSEDGTLHFTETAGGEPVTEDIDRLRWYMENGHLHIRFDGRQGWKFGIYKQAEKHLTIHLPADMTLKTLTFDLVSAGAYLTDTVATGVADINTVSGDIWLSGCRFGTLNADTISGSVDIIGGDYRFVNANTVSGTLRTQNATIDRLDFESTSGDCKLAGAKVLDMDVDTASGSLTVSADASLRNIDFDSISGSLQLFLSPDTKGFIADFDSTSGRFSSSLPTTEKEGMHIAGNGDLKISMDTTSGDLTILQNDQNTTS